MAEPFSIRYIHCRNSLYTNSMFTYQYSSSMEKWPPQQRAFVCERFFITQSYVQAIRDFRIEYSLRPRDPIPSRNSVNLWVKNFRQTATATKQKPPGQPRTVRTPENETRVRTSLQRSPRRSAGKHAQALGMSRRSFSRMLKAINFHPYKILITQELKYTDYAARLRFAEKMKELLDNEEIDQWGIVGPYFFQGTINTERYLEMLKTFLIPELKKKRKFYRTFFQQDDATCHTAKKTLDFLREEFGTRLLSRNTEFPWPPRSPDLSVCDFFLWGYLKQRVYANKPRTLDQLRANIRREIAEIKPAMLKKVYDNFKKRLENCIACNGHHLADIIFGK
ncbi:uncharacterized protein LOC105206592 isoform X2 [Solenopsis invicta]|uniref:uncharacterized protein LOC105206592 isoform X2 n=1 Tax=Solenopsis invicta TaxID=13686 RepID=UPI00193E4C1D|nr:uncharacterized protein LOC105206592 isoform X2 [Solenopsis invicta]